MVPTRFFLSRNTRAQKTPRDLRKTPRSCRSVGWYLLQTTMHRMIPHRCLGSIFSHRFNNSPPKDEGTNKKTKHMIPDNLFRRTSFKILYVFTTRYVFLCFFRQLSAFYIRRLEDNGVGVGADVGVGVGVDVASPLGVNVQLPYVGRMVCTISPGPILKAGILRRKKGCRCQKRRYYWDPLSRPRRKLVIQCRYPLRCGGIEIESQSI